VSRRRLQLDRETRRERRSGNRCNLEGLLHRVGSGECARGSTTFDIANDGPSTHEFEVIRTDLAVDALPVSSAQVNVDSLDLVDEVGDTAPGTLTHLTVDLTPGNYVLICNVAGHYQAGMRIAFTAT
jgi:uncharacterized cupredoxin-like copper-binding protein